MLKRNLISLLLLSIYLISCLFIYTKNCQKPTATSTSQNQYNPKDSFPIESNEIIGTLTIEKIKLEKNLYNLNSPENNVDKNVTLLVDNENLIVIAAHSGTGPLAYFNDLDRLKINDEVDLTLHNNTYIFIVTKIENQTKDGTIELDKQAEKSLVLTTCNKNDKTKQLVLICTEKNEA